MAIWTIIGALLSFILVAVQARSWYDDDKRYYGHRGYYGYGISGFGRGRGIGIGVGGGIGGYFGGFRGGRGRFGGRRGGDFDDFEFERDDFGDIGDRFEFDDDDYRFRRGFGGIGGLRGGGLRRRGFGGIGIDYDDIFDDGFGRYRGFGGRLRGRRGFGKFPGYGYHGYGRYHGYSVDSPKSFNNRFIGGGIKNTYYDGGALHKYSGNYNDLYDNYGLINPHPDFQSIFLDYTDENSYPDYLKQYFENQMQTTGSDLAHKGSDLLNVDHINMSDSIRKYTEYSGKSDDSGKYAEHSGKYPSYIPNEKTDYPKVKKKY